MREGIHISTDRCADEKDGATAEDDIVVEVDEEGEWDGGSYEG